MQVRRMWRRKPSRSTSASASRSARRGQSIIKRRSPQPRPCHQLIANSSQAMAAVRWRQQLAQVGAHSFLRRKDLLTCVPQIVLQAS